MFGVISETQLLKQDSGGLSIQSLRKKQLKLKQLKVFFFSSKFSNRSIMTLFFARELELFVSLKNILLDHSKKKFKYTNLIYNIIYNYYI